MVLDVRSVDSRRSGFPDSTTTMTDADPPFTTDRPPRPRHHLILLLVPILTIVVAGYVAGASWPSLLQHHPQVLIALSPINRFLLLTTNELPFWNYFGVGLVRHLIPDPLFFLLGAWYGDRALRWAGETYPIVTKVVGDDGRQLEDERHRRIIYPLALLAPNNWVSLLCGAARIPFRTFVVLNVTGTVIRLLLFRWIGSLFRSEIRAIADFVARYQWPVTALSVVGVLLTIAWQFRKGTGELVGLTRMSEELEGDE